MPLAYLRTHLRHGGYYASPKLFRDPLRFTLVITSPAFHTCAGECIALEVDGPHHFTANTRALGGGTAARHRLLNAAGWAVVSVPYFLWAALDDGVRGAWLLQARLAQQRVTAFPSE